MDIVWYALTWIGVISGVWQLVTWGMRLAAYYIDWRTEIPRLRSDNDRLRARVQQLESKSMRIARGEKY